MTKRERIQFFLIWLALGLLPLFFRPLYEPDEGRYAEIPREMLAMGDWLTPRLNGVLYFEKPPLQYWLSAISMGLFGLKPWAARLPLALATGLAMWSAWRLARRLGAMVPMWAAFLAASSLLAFVCGQILTLDALFSAFMVTALACAVEAVSTRYEGRNGTPWTLGAFLSLALAMLTKGLAGPVLVGGAFLASLPFAWNHPRLRRAVLRTFLDPLGWVVFLAVAVPWFVLVEQANPGHARFFFIHEHFARFSSHVHARQGSNNWFLDKLYFLVVLAVGLLPWLSMSLVGLFRAVGFVKRKGPQTDQGPFLRWGVALVLLSVAVPMAFFTLSGSKLAPYILPAIVPLVALACTFEEEHEAWKALKRSGWELLFLGGLFTFALPSVLKDEGMHALGRAAILPWTLALGMAFLALGFWALRPKGLTGNRWMTAHALALVFLVGVAAAIMNTRKSVQSLVAQAPREAQWISHGYYFQGIAFQTRSRVTVIQGTGELKFGSENLPEAERERWFQDDPLALTAVGRRLQAESPERPVWALVDRSSWKDLPETEKESWEVMDRTHAAWMIRLKPAALARRQS